MGSRWEIWLDDASGNRVALLDSAVAWEVIRVVNEVGAFQIVLPGDFNVQLVGTDSIVEFWRAPDDGALQWIGTGFITDVDLSDDNDGRESVTLSGPDIMDLLTRRIIAYASGSAQAYKTDQADDMCKAIVLESMGSTATDASRRLSSTAFQVAGYDQLAPTITKGFSWRNVLVTIQEIAEASRQSGTRLYFDLVQRQLSNYQIGFQFNTYIGQRGADRTSSSKNPTFFGKLWGNLQTAKLSMSKRYEINYAYVGGQGDGDIRAIEEVYSDSLLTASPWSRRETFVDARNESSTDGLYAKGLSALSSGRPVNKFTGQLLNTAQTRYGIEWGFGDRVTCEHRGLQFDAEVRAVRFKVDDSGMETIEAKIEAEL